MSDVAASESKPTAWWRTAAEQATARRDWLPALVGGGTVGALAAIDGGYFPTAWGWSSLGLLWVAAVALIVGRRVVLGARELVFLGGLGSLLVWIALSAVWSASVPSTVAELERGVVYVAAALALLFVTRREGVPSLLAGVLAAVTAASAYGLATRLFPERLGAFDSLAGYRLFEPIGYWNGLAILASIGIALAVGFGGRARTATGRALAAGALVLLAPALFFTFSRGAWVALGVGLVAAVALDPRRLQLVASLAFLAPAPAIAVWLASRSDALTTTESTLAEASRDGHRLALVLVGLAILAVLLALAFSLAERRVAVGRRARLAFAGTLAVLLAVLLGALFARYGSPPTLASKAWDAFNAPPPAAEGDLTQRLFSLSSNGRIELGKAAIDDFEANPVLGSGAGTFEEWWLRHRTIEGTARDAHSLYLEVLGELGPIGLALLLTALAAPLAAVARARRHPLAAGAIAAYVAFLFHAGVDWDWELPAITIAALFCGAALLVLARREEARPVPAAARRAALGATLVLAAFAFVGFVGNSYLDASQDALDSSRWALARDKAQAARRWAPWSSEPWSLLGQAEVGIGNLGAARDSYSTAIAKDRENWDIWLNLALASEGQERERALAETARLNPLSGELAEIKAEPKA